jgi:hypothetical protein
MIPSPGIILQCSTCLFHNVLPLDRSSFPVTPDLDNTGLRLGWHVGNSVQEWPLVEAKPFINQCADITERQAFPLRFRQSFGLPVESSLAYPMHCWYQTTNLVDALPSTCKLMMDEDAIGGIYTLYLNGKRITAQDFVADSQHDYQQLVCEVQQFLKPGINHLTNTLNAMLEGTYFDESRHQKGRTSLQSDAK